MANLTRYISSVTVLTEDVANSWYGGLYGTLEGDSLEADDPLVAGHVHDGQHLDGHAQKIDLEQHVTGQIQNSRIADDAITKRNIKGFTTQADAIPVSEVIDGTTYYYLDVSESGAFTTTSNVTSNSPGTLTTDDFVFGSDSLDDDANTGHDQRFLFDKSKGAFRAGGVTSTEWDNSNRGNFSVAFGSNNKASGSHSSVIGGSTNTAATSYSTAAGLQTVTEYYGEHAFSNGAFDVAGDNKCFQVMWRATTTDATATEMFLNGTSERLTLNNHEVMTVRIIVTGIRTDSLVGSGFGFIRDLCIRRGASVATTEIVASSATDLDNGIAVDFSVGASTTIGALQLSAIGESGKTYQWIAHGQCVKIKADP